MNRTGVPVLGLLGLCLLHACGGGDGETPLVVASAAPPDGTTGQPYPGYTFTASGGAPPLHWSQSGALPAGMSLDDSGSLAGTPVTAGAYLIVVTVTDSSTPTMSAQAPVNLHINDSPIVVSASPPPPAGIVTYPYAFSFTASGGSPPYTWRSQGTLPPGLTVESGGTVSGTPTGTGSYSFSVIASDSAQPPASGPPLATRIVVNKPDPLALNSTPAPPDGLLGNAYAPFFFSASGGYRPLSWAVTSGNPPPGLVLGSDGSLGGTPTRAGPATFTVTVTDSAATPATSSRPFTMTINVPPPPTINNTPPPTGTVGVAYPGFQFTATDGAPPLRWDETGALPGLTLSPDGVLGGTPTAAGKFPIILDVTDALSRAAPALPVIVRVSLARDGSFTATGAMAVSRSGHTATLLNSGKVLIAGGGQGHADPSAELFDPVTGTFAATGDMTEPRMWHVATLLDVPASPGFGKVLILGPSDSTAELYDPATGLFAATGNLTQTRGSPTATLLKTGTAKLGMVLVVGGNSNNFDYTAELYDPATGTFHATGSTNVPRQAGHSATQLLDGRVLIAGGGTETAEVYDPVSGKFAPTGSMAVPRTGHTAIRLKDGTVLIFGPGGTAELYDPRSGTFSPAGSLNYAVTNGLTGSLRADGSVLATGGTIATRCAQRGRVPISVAQADLFGPESGGFTSTGPLINARDSHTTTTLADGRVLVAGGVRHERGPPASQCKGLVTPLSSAELFK